MDSTIKYYDENAIEYFEKTKCIAMEPVYTKFEQYLPRSGFVLDLGCGSGRDSLYFLKRGYRVTAVDASKEMCKLAAGYAGIDVANILIEDIPYVGIFDGIWANASLLHIEKNKTKEVLIRCISALKKGGYLYASWKCGDKERIIDGLI